MASILKAWPPWPRFTESNGELKTENCQYKQEIMEKYGEEAIQQSWLKTCRNLEVLTAKVAAKGTSTIPVLTLNEILNASKERKDELKEVGCFVVRGVVDRFEATGWFQGLKRYVEDNKKVITGAYFFHNLLFREQIIRSQLYDLGWPLETPVILDIFHSPSQQAARSHPNILKLTRELNSLWHDATEATSPDQLSYAGWCEDKSSTDYREYLPAYW
jgi:hypothetical protein